MVINQRGVREVIFSELWDAIGGGTSFTVDDIISMMAECLRAEEPFKLIFRDDRYEISVKGLRDYFETHPTPDRPMKVEERLKLVQAELQEARRQLHEQRNWTRAVQATPESLKQAQEAGLQAALEPTIVPEPPFNPMDTIFPGQIETPREEEKGVPTENSYARTFTVPAEPERQKESFASIADQLKADLLRRKVRPQVKNRAGDVPLL